MIRAWHIQLKFVNKKSEHRQRNGKSSTLLVELHKPNKKTGTLAPDIKKICIITRVITYTSNCVDTFLENLLDLYVFLVYISRYLDLLKTLIIQQCEKRKIKTPICFSLWWIYNHFIINCNASVCVCFFSGLVIGISCVKNQILMVLQ